VRQQADDQAAADDARIFLEAVLEQQQNEKTCKQTDESRPARSLREPSMPQAGSYPFIHRASLC
jgi:hypothetical protein